MSWYIFILLLPKTPEKIFIFSKVKFTKKKKNVCQRKRYSVLFTFQPTKRLKISYIRFTHTNYRILFRHLFSTIPRDAYTQKKTTYNDTQSGEAKRRKAQKVEQ